MRKSTINDDVLSTRDAAERLGVALRTVQLWVESGVLPAWKTAGGHRRISRAAVEKLIEERRQALLGGRVDSRLGEIGPPAPTGTSSRLRILVVEDEAELLDLFTMVIKGWQLPLDLTVAANGFDALLRMGQHCPDVLITDLRMPGMDGFGMIEALRRAGSAFDGLTVCVVTVLSDEEIRSRGGLPPGVRVFRKPVPFDALEEVVRGCLANRQAARTAPAPLAA